MKIARIMACVAMAVPCTVQGVMAKELGTPAMPVGVQIVGKGTPLNRGPSGLPGGVSINDPKVSFLNNYGNLQARPILADENGMVIYTSDKDENDKSNCVDQCAQTWKPLLAPKKAAAFGDWRIVARPDGASQWSYRHKPLYTYSGDTTFADPSGEKDGWKAIDFAAAATAGGVLDAGRSVAPGGVSNAGVALPAGILTEAVDDAMGVVLTDHLGKTLYAFSGKPSEDPTICSKTPCQSVWTPVLAPPLVAETAALKKMRRPDGTDQWAYEGMPLFTFDGDAIASQVNGYAHDQRWQPAVVVRYPTPPGLGITMQWTLVNGLTLADAKGKSLYRQYIYYYSVNGHDERKGYPYKMWHGRALGGKGCVDECLDSWEPLKAAKDAKPVGYWNIITRPDGTRQWAYREQAMYTYKGDKKPGDQFGVNTWQISVNDPELGFQSQLQKIGINAEIMPGLVFTTAYP
jgi:predicted lipoprotein with Yx(FWY)xxD motif